MDVRCSFSNCIHIPEFLCSCSGQNAIFCTKHFESHIKKNSVDHHIKNLHIHIRETEKEKIISKLKEEIDKTQKLISQTTQKCSDVINEVISLQNSLYSNARLYLSKCKFVLSQVLTKDQIAYLNTNSNKPITEISLELLQSELKKMHASKYYTSLNLNKSVNSFLDILKTGDLVESFMILKHKPLENLLLSVKEYQKSLFYYNINENSQQEIQLDLENPLESQSTACWIDENTIFIQNDSQKLTGNAYIYNKNAKSLIKAPSTIKRTGAQPIVHNGKIYFFGGISDKKCLSTCDYYDIKNIEWNNFTEMPECNFCTSNLILGENIIIATHRCKVFEYNLEGNSFNLLAKNTSFTGGHFIVRYCDNIYLIGNKCYNCSIYMINEWKMYKVYSGPNIKCGGSRPIVRDNNIYFIANDNHAYKLDLISLFYTQLT
ncbi:hypothetical protein SteCoe_14201 [Stentor coeruleus]|uniref:Kelch motif family protein n=1 Tax=Stentor coeruleus TaxID=5963 RepID=A0A1R2C6L1_9CILI|nr:hypothetical protein SteCoe_14201 [Stentor coeruleus]